MNTSRKQEEGQDGFKYLETLKDDKIRLTAVEDGKDMNVPRDGRKRGRALHSDNSINVITQQPNLNIPNNKIHNQRKY